MWIIKTDVSGQRILRGRTDQGDICHQIATARGIYDESNVWAANKRSVSFGRYDLDSNRYQDVQIPGVGYVHTGNDRAGRFLFIENKEVGVDGGAHQLLSIHYPHDPDRFHTENLRTLQPIIRGQRDHAHPLLGPDRRWLYFTEVVDGYSQIHALDVSNLVDLDEYWDHT